MGDGVAREVELTLCLGDGRVLGTTRRFTADGPWPQFVWPVVAEARALLGLDMTVLRLQAIEERADGTPDLVRYLAEVDAPPLDASLLLGAVATGASDDRPPPPAWPEPEPEPEPEPLRMPWAVPGGPARALRWATARLRELEIAATGPPQQVRTWNLSSLWIVPTDRGAAWLKQVPPFFAHEGAIIERMSRHRVPRLLARDSGVVLLAEIPGEDLYDATDAQRAAMIDLLIGIQLDAGRPADGVERLFELGLPDWRLPALAGAGARALEASADRLSAAVRDGVTGLLDGLDARARRLEACGLADTLVHGDFHSGNVRGTGSDLTLLDWGDSGIGHPLLDEAAFTARLSAADAATARSHWVRAWAAAVPGSDAAEAMRLLAPVSALRQAVIYQGFLDRIEPDERVYHRDDPVEWLVRAADLVGRAPLSRGR
ncbi:phosphotransferase [Agromyces salentinus]|uniref:Aminoglycoside phosphotransferase domain-containing protein n=1 Tax=Agromyces salentinus TaxID=269421 RepID=A0ABN2MPL8_9MICO|nr:phosphotransferase [Agromyces salentinus]